MAKLTRKLWVGIGAATIAGASFAGAHRGARAQHKGTSPHRPRTPTRRPPTTPAQGGEAYLTDGGPRDTRIRFYRDIELMRGHLLVGGQLIELGLWDEALPHFLHPTEELYGADGEIHQAAQHPPLPAASCRRWRRPSRPSARAPTSRRCKVVDQRLDGALAVARRFMTPAAAASRHAPPPRC